MTVLKFALLRNLRTSRTLLLSMVMPIGVILFLPSLAYYPVVGVGLLSVVMFMAAGVSAGLVLEDRLDGSIARVLVSPVSSLSYIAQNVLAAMVPTFIYMAILVVAGLLRYNWGIVFTLGAAFALLLFAFTNIAFAFFFNLFFESKEGSNYTFMLVAAVVMVLSGLLIPREALPAVVAHIGAVFHPFWLLRALSTLYEYGITLQFWVYQLVMALFAGGFLLLGSKKR